MSNLFLVFLGSLIGSTLGIMAVGLLFSNKKLARVISLLTTPFAAGALLAAAFLDLLPEGIEQGEATNVLMWALAGLLIFFILERFLHWFHHEHQDLDESKTHTAPLIIIGDTIHNAIDGVAIAASFLVSPATGFITSFAVAAHEVPQEIGDFGLLLKFGYSRAKVFAINILSSLTTTPVALLTFIAGESASFPLPQLLGLTAGFFIYISVADLIPAIHAQSKKRIAFEQIALLLAGILLVAAVSTWAHGYIESDHEGEDLTHQEQIHTDG